MRDRVIPSLKEYGIEYWTKMAAGHESRLASGTTADGKPLSEQQKTRLREQAETVRRFLPKIPELRVVLPTVTVEDALTIHAGDVEIRIVHPGPGNTRGDVAVFLPRQKILATGDLLVHPVPFAYGSFPPEWIDALKKLRALDAGVIVPGHGPVMRDADHLDQVIALLESLVAQVRSAVDRGLSLEDTRKAVDLQAFRARLAGDDPVRNGVFSDSILRVAIERAYTAAKKTAAGQPRF
jgi:glyoxylase-like metal-dependent hydrolase (beta-lactamase superfamily II)